MVFNQTVSVPALMTRLMHFYAHESCGKCTPCREGTNWLVKIHDRLMAGGGRYEDIDILSDICNNIAGRSFCPLGDAAAWPLVGPTGTGGALEILPARVRRVGAQRRRRQKTRLRPAANGGGVGSPPQAPSWGRTGKEEFRHNIPLSPPVSGGG